MSLYNALSGAHYDNPDDIEFTTIEDAIYLGMKNDVSFIILDKINLWEHQSSFNPNMPIRFLIYAGQLYDKYLTVRDAKIYGKKIYILPKPKCICFYNGTEAQPEERILKLSDAFQETGDAADIEVSVRMLNINYGMNKKLMECCEALNSYSSFVRDVRRYEKETGRIDLAVKMAIDTMPGDFVLKKFLLAHYAEVNGMILTEYDEEKVRRLLYEEAIEDGLEQGFNRGHAEGLSLGREEGREEEKELFVKRMLDKKLPISFIAEMSLLSEDRIRKLAEAQGLLV